LPKDIEMRLVCHMREISLPSGYTLLPQSYVGHSVATAMNQRLI
jgi:hypothetical protein